MTGETLSIPFVKMHGEGNDFIMIETLQDVTMDYADLASQVCHRHFGVGADGLMYPEPSDVADIRMTYINADGSPANMCGNGIRCFSKFVSEKGLVANDTFTIETRAGILTAELRRNPATMAVEKVRIDMGKATFDCQAIPVAISNKDECLNETIILEDGSSVELSSVLMGVPHTIVYRNDVHWHDITTQGREIESLSMFPNRTNVNFVQVLDRGHILVDTWERGAGHTLACGTGVCASVVISNKLGKTDSKVQVKVPGGALEIEIMEDGTVYMTGGAVNIAKGEFNYRR